ncbi:CPBP family intramembrane glutamic endopeptidase [Streptomonospora wellingtoniae]|uniref:Type II CAAX endopeptidase family protein n=1 Tax=Streptomonospora wellingtoniae TaxID=3075544 RepID=A0ABU2KN12_9ACTN|nr:type II CAAX endopeptidase family protein [Streptomonospora sp. DSM 45055]MDT0300659.1 type II CAAX endopeptidase family protein [Streptomonospora sp. DSM 45055]
MSNARDDLRPAPAGAPSRKRPGWPEIGAGLFALVAATAPAVFFGPRGLDLDPVPYGLILAAWSGVAGLAGFAAAALLRIRSLNAFSVRRTTWRWLLVGMAGGIAALLAKAAVVSAVAAVTGYESDPQGMYYDAAGGGVVPLILTMLFLAVLTPIGEEFLFRGVVANALLRYGPVVGAVSSSLVFAVFHGINIVFPAAFVVGLIAAELMRRSGSVWPGVVVHAVNNTALPLLVLLTGYAGPT